MILAFPSHMGQALPVVQRILLPAPAAFLEGEPMRPLTGLHAASLRSSSGLTARGRGFILSTGKNCGFRDKPCGVW
jgi:hypothetical protein